MTLKNTLNYSPQELNFGTSGLRGLETDMTDLECYINARGFIHFLESSHGLRKGGSIALAGDLRRSTPRILKAVASAITESGYITEYAGRIPTPALAYYALGSNIPSIMVTGSHIPADRNGIKFYRADSEVMKDDEASIKNSVTIVREEVYAQDSEASLFTPEGTLKNAVDLPDENTDVLNNFLERYTSVFPSTVFTQKHIIVYQHSAVGRDFLVTLLEKLGAKVTPVQRSETFISIDTENVTPADQENFKKIAAEYPDNFAIVSTDGDSDRPFVVDETGVFHRGDVLGAVVATELCAQFASLPVSASDAVDSVLEQHHISLSHTKIGSPYVIKQMEDDSRTGVSTGWEVNGGFMTSSDITYKNGTLTQLPTRDAFLPILIALTIAAEKHVALSEVFAALPPRYTQAGLLDNFPQEKSTAIIETLGKNNANSQALIAQVFTPENGFAAVQSVDTTDGIKIFFANQDIAHIRPSGNAPQLRIYATADNQDRADTIVNLSLADGGILRTLETLV